jgi:hypothetical protein
MASSKVPSGKRGSRGFIVGRSRFAKISAVEGIRTTEEMDKDFREFDRRGLSARERRTLIERKYTKTR